MRKLFIIFGLLITAIIMPGMACATIQIAVFDDPVLEFNMQSDKTAYKSGETIRLTLTFRNKSKADINFCTYDLRHGLKSGLGFKTVDEKFVYILVDWTRRKMPIRRPKDFVLLKPGEEYRIELAVETALPNDLTWKFVDYSDPDGLNWGQGSTKLPEGEYQVKTAYMNLVDYYQEWVEEGGYTTTRNIPVENVWTGNLACHEVTIAITPQSQSLSPWRKKGHILMLWIQN